MRSTQSIRNASMAVLLSVAGVVAAGCDVGTSPTHADKGLATGVQAQVATSALALRGAPAGSAAATDQPAASRGVRPAPSAAGDPPHPTPAPEPQLTDLKIRRLVLARDVEAREPVGAADAFDLGEVDKLYAFVEVGNHDAVESEIVVTFEPERGPACGHVRLRVGASPRWRTWAYTRGVRQPGKWTAVVRDAAGELLARKSFEVKAVEAEPSEATTPAVEQSSQASQRDAAAASDKSSGRG